MKGSKEPHIWHIKTNKWGFRGGEVSIEKPDNTLRVICLGGSTTYDTVTDGRTWPEKLEAILQKKHPTKKVQVFNFGMNAASLPFNIVQFALLGVHFKPDLVILYAGHNDLWAGIGLKDFRPDYSHSLRHWDDSRVSAQHYIPRWAMKSAFVTALVVAFDRKRGIEYDLVRQILRFSRSEDPLEGSWAFQNGIITLQGIAEVHGARLLVITPHWGFRKNDIQKKFVDQIKETANNAGIPLLDAYSQFPVGDSSLQIDDVHFSDKGGTLFAQMIADAIEIQQLLVLEE
ncbi:MAG: SGNH/GDSL hydrolase family protein [Thermoplasmata archaeon]|nr:MAG: SGNH/GDSL hydrolase family protein [Thermoplasmata archaeon]